MFASSQSNDLYGVPITEDAFERLISIENPYRYEFIDEVVYDMTESNPEHSELVGNIFNFIHTHIAKEGSCQVYRDCYVSIPFKPSVMSDIIVTCNSTERDDDQQLEAFKVQAPHIVIEVLSPSTENYDRTEKFARYQCSPSLEVYMLAHLDEPYVEVYRRETNWRQERISTGQTIKLSHIGLELPVDMIYAGIFS